MPLIDLPVVKFPPEYKRFRDEVRSFLEKEREKGTFTPAIDSWLGGYHPEFSQKLGKMGWIGMTWPKAYGGAELTALERYIVIEELLAAGAPVACHWFADRQTGPLLLRYGTEQQKQYFLPKIASGTCYFAIGLSEPNSGSDLASLSTRAERTEGGWLLNGTKIWTSGAHYSHYMIVLCRTSPKDEKNRHAGMSQLIVDLQSPGVTIRPITYLTGEHHFNEVIFENVLVPEKHLVGEEGKGWKQSMAELAYERSGPERILSTFLLLQELIEVLKKNNDEQGLREAMKLVARLQTLRQMSIGVAQYLDEGKDVNLVAAIVKDMGTEFEKCIVKTARLLVRLQPTLQTADLLNQYFAQAVLHAPGFTLRGGTTEILRGIVAKGMMTG